jgi:fumarate reductase iron-sulfur subunit
MSADTIQAKVFRFDPSVDAEPHYDTYEVPFEEGMSAMDVLDYIYQNLDGTLAYYDHAGCSLGICGRCTGKMNGKAGLFCQTLVEGDVTLEPLSKDKALKDLVIDKDSLAKSSVTATGEKGGASASDIGSVPTLTRREIEALIAVPLIKAFAEEFGKEETLKVVEKAMGSLARAAGTALKNMAGGDTLEDFHNKVMPLFGQGGALEVEVLEATPTHVAFNVTRCRYAEMYRKHGLGDFGYILSCARDFPLIEGFNPKIKFTRTQTVMEGADFCDFRLSL